MATNTRLVKEISTTRPLFYYKTKNFAVKRMLDEYYEYLYNA
ncbi:MAG: hypothetical protein SFU99_23455 [Saprospiraceae bacterium]|nr:hypothetical protein [Saprospiraceae bacterium]